MMHLTSVLLPAPFSPSSAWTEPRWSRNETLSSASTEPNCLEIPIASSAGVAASTTATAPSSSSRLTRGPHPPRPGPSRQGLQERARAGDRPEHAVLHLHHLDRRRVVAGVGGRAAVLEQQTLVAAVVRLAHGGVDADVRGDAGQDQVGDPPLAQDEVEVRRAEGPLPRLVDDRLSRPRRQLGDDVPPRLAPDQDAAAGSRVADADPLVAGRPPRAPALVGGQVGEIRAVPLARVDDRVAARAHAGQDASDRLDAGARQTDVVAEQIDVAALAAEVGLHVDHHQRRVLAPEIAVPGPGIWIAGDVSRVLHGFTHLATRSSAGCPTSARSRELVRTMITSVSA